MAKKDIIMLSQKELKRLHIIQQVLDGVMKQVEAAEILVMSDRQIRRLIKRVRIEGDAGIAHKGRGRPSGRKLPVKIKERVIELYREKLKGFGPTFAAEKVFELEGIQISDETLRLWLIKAGDWKKARKGRKHRQWRERKHYPGKMIQMDGSHHDWFEGRGPKCVLMGYIDDATSKVFARFHEYEGTIPAMDSCHRYIRKNGIPVSIYFDRHTTYKSPAKPTIEEELSREDPVSEFGRALKELGVKLIHAYSPQAKGRIERLFGTLQDRLVKEMRLRGISTIAEANKFLDSHYLREFNRKFQVEALSKGNLHRPIPKGLNLQKILCIRTVRTIRNDFTISHNSNLYQIKEAIKNRKVLVEEHTNGTMKITNNGKNVKFKSIEERPEIMPKEPKVKRRRRRTYTPIPSNHPLKRTYNIIMAKKDKLPLEAVI